MVCLGIQFESTLISSNLLQALLLFPPMGRRKISYQGTPYGRNELISYYLTARYWEPFGYVPEEMCEREHYPGYKNKRLVSNNMQAMKKSFQHHPLGIVAVLKSSSSLANIF